MHPHALHAGERIAHSSVCVDRQDVGVPDLPVLQVRKPFLTFPRQVPRRIGLTLLCMGLSDGNYLPLNGVHRLCPGCSAGTAGLQHAQCVDGGCHGARAAGIQEGSLASSAAGNHESDNLQLPMHPGGHVVTHVDCKNPRCAGGRTAPHHCSAEVAGQGACQTV